MTFKVEFEYIEEPGEEERILKFSKILSQGIYVHLRNKGLLQIDPERKEKAQCAVDKAREITRRALVLSVGHSD